LRGKIFAREPKQSPAALFVQNRAEQKNYLYIFCFCTRHFFNSLKEKAIFLRGGAAWRHGGGAERLDLFRNFW